MARVIGRPSASARALSADGAHRFRHEGSTELSSAADPQEAARALGFSLGEAVKAEGGELILPPE